MLTSQQNDDFAQTSEWFVIVFKLKGANWGLSNKLLKMTRPVAKRPVSMVVFRAVRASICFQLVLRKRNIGNKLWNFAGRKPKKKTTMILEGEGSMCATLY